ncbi:MAG: PAS-domain containing protein [Proteobacteria bacterium]|nr:PAS-domain containing protein [Pseudomonadota bacterium]
MPATPPSGRRLTIKLQLALLLVAAMAFVATMLAMFVGGHRIGPDQLSMRQFATVSIIAGAVFIAGLIIWHMGSVARKEARKARAESQHLRRNLAAADAIIRAEPQILVFWEQGHAVRIVSHTLTDIPGIPEQHAEILRFGQWLETTSADALKASLDRLFANGRSFNLILKTGVGGTLEGEGRAAGGRAVLRFKDVSTYKAEIARIDEQHAALARDIKSSRALLDTLPMPVWLRDPTGRLIWVNTAYVKAVEADSELEVLDRQIELLETRQRKHVAKAIAAGESYKARVHLIVGGQRKPHDIVILPVEGMTAGAAIDVTEIETAQGELDRQIAAYDRTLDRVETAVALFDRDQRLVFYNAAFTNLWSLDTEWLATRPSASDVLDRLREIGILPPVVSHRDWKAQVLASSRTGTPLEDTWPLTDGRIINVIAEQRPDGGVTYLFADETDRIALESRYNALIDVQTETLDSLKEGVAVFGTDGRLKLVNRAFCEIWQIPRNKLAGGPHIGEIIAAVETLFPDAGTWMRIGRAATAFQDERETFSGQMDRTDHLVIDYALMPLPDGATLLTFADVTNAKLAERALVERNEALVAADRLKSNFISHISYELRTPLQTIIGFSELLTSPALGALNDKQREYLADIMFSSKTLLAIINDILDLTSIEAGGLELKLAPAGVRAIIDAAILGIRERAVRSRLTIDIAVADDVNEIMVDEARMRQVLYNLLSNAVGFSKVNGTVHLACWRENGTVNFRIDDEGIGIPKDQIGRVFQRFESRSRGSDHRGAGLGLSIAKSLVELHGGTIEITSEEGRGTRVIVRIPEKPVARKGSGGQGTRTDRLAGGSRAA